MTAPVDTPQKGRFANWPHWTMFLLVASLAINLLLLPAVFAGIAFGRQIVETE